MACTRKQLADWLATFKDEDIVAIDEGGLSLEIYRTVGEHGKTEWYFEVGGYPNDDEHDEIKEAQ